MRYALLLAFALWRVPESNAQPRSLDSVLRRTLASIVVSQALPGATAAVSIDGHVISVAAGMADRDRQIAMTPAHRMLVGSAGKPFFAFVALSLAADGKLDLDAPISRWLGSEPWFNRLPSSRQLTMRHLLSHRGGIANHAGDSSFAALVRDATPQRRSRGFSVLEQISLVLDRPAPFAVGDGFLYSDTGYLLAGLVLERVAGRTYYEEVQSRVLTPFHLDQTSPADHADLAGLPQGYIVAPVPPAAAIGFARWGLPDKMVADGRLVLNPVYEWTGGGFVSTSADLARWMETLFEGATSRTIGKTMVATQPPNAPYGLGIFVREAADGAIYSHPGGFPGYRTEVAYSTELGVGVAFQANHSAPGGASVIPALLDAVRTAIAAEKPKRK